MSEISKVNGNLVSARAKRYLEIAKEGSRIEKEKKEIKAELTKEMERCGITDEYVRGEIKLSFLRRSATTIRVPSVEMIEKKFGIKLTEDCFTDLVTKKGSEYWDIKEI